MEINSGVGVVSANVEIGGLEHHDGRSVRTLFKRRVEGRGQQAAAIIDGQSDDVGRAQAQIADGALHGAVNLSAGKNADGRRAKEALLFHIPPATRQQTVAGGREAGGMRHLASGDEGEAGGGRQSQYLLEPAAGDLFHHGGGRPALVGDGILVPGGSQPIGSQCGLHRSADHPAEEAAAGRSHDAALHIAQEFGNDAIGRYAFIG